MKPFNNEKEIAVKTMASENDSGPLLEPLEPYGSPFEELEQSAESHNMETCEDGPEGECILCAMRTCRWKEPFHFHHDGCPACTVYANKDEN